MAPIGHTLRGVYFESDRYEATSFNLWIFAQPMFVPAQNINFNIGNRIDAPERGPWDFRAPDLTANLRTVLESQALPFLRNIVTPLDVVNEIARRPYSLNINGQQAMAYAYARVGNAQSAVSIISELVPRLDESVPWQLEMRDRAAHLRSLLLNDPLGAQKQLDQWESDTISNLSLAEFR